MSRKIYSPNINILVVDDSAVMRHFLKEELNQFSGIEVVGTAPDAFIARNKLLFLQPHVIVLDIQMPKMDGITFLKKIMKYRPIPVIIFSSYTKSGADLTLSALEAGAIDYVQKPKSTQDVKKTVRLLADKIKQASKANLSQKSQQESKKQKIIPDTTIDNQKIIAIGASTGGTVAIKEILTKLPLDFPPIIIVQHMPPYFTKAFADRLNSICDIEVKEAQDNDRLYAGTALVTPGDYHMELKKNGSDYLIRLNQNDNVYNQRPSVEVLFNSVAKVVGKNSIGVILTGMGSDGAKGLLEMKKAGAYTIAQDKESSVVFGMPKQAIKLGAVLQVASLSEMPSILTNLLRS